MLFSSFSRFPGSVLGVKNSKKAKSYSSFKDLSTWGGDMHLQCSECQEWGMGGVLGTWPRLFPVTGGRRICLLADFTGIWEVE